MRRTVSVDYGIVSAIMKLTADEGHSILIPCENPDPVCKGTNMYVVCVGDWTGWEELAFHGVDLLECLSEAVKGMRRVTGEK